MLLLHFFAQNAPTLRATRAANNGRMTTFEARNELYFFRRIRIFQNYCILSILKAKFRYLNRTRSREQPYIPGFPLYQRCSRRSQKPLSDLRPAMSSQNPSEYTKMQFCVSGFGPIRRTTAVLIVFTLGVPAPQMRFGSIFWKKSDFLQNRWNFDSNESSEYESYVDGRGMESTLFFT